MTSPSAEVQGHSESERKTVGGRRNITILSVDSVGNYAVRLGCDNMHNTGIYSWAFLHKIGGNAGQLFQSYLDDLAAKASIATNRASVSSPTGLLSCSGWN